jgi:hypothetical protein
MMVVKMAAQLALAPDVNRCAKKLRKGERG